MAFDEIEKALLK